MKKFQECLLALALVTLGGVAAHGQNYPDKTVRMIVPYPPSGTSDILARYLSQQLQEKWKVPVVVDNRPGAAGNIGMDVAAKSPKDGYTLVMTNSAAPSNVSLYTTTFDVEKDLVPLGLIGSTPMVMAVNPKVDAKTLSGLTALAKAEPGKLTYGSCGLGTPQQLAVELYQSLTDTKLFHIPYRGCAPAVTDAISGQVQVLATTAAQMAPLLATGLLRGLAVTTRRRSVTVPDIPTFEEAGLPGYELDISFGLMAPAGTPKARLDKIYADVKELLDTPQAKAKLLSMGVEMNLTSPDEHAKVLHADIQKYAALIARLKLGTTDNNASR